MHSITKGAPQGSIIGPALFILYVNDLFINEFRGNIMYADDLTLINSDKNLENLQHINSDLKIIGDWIRSNHLLINHKKSNYMLFGVTKNVDIKIKIHGNYISKAKEAKILGLIFDDN